MFAKQKAFVVIEGGEPIGLFKNKPDATQFKNSEVPKGYGKTLSIKLDEFNDFNSERSNLRHDDFRGIKF